jgi:GT2 family glycosyltransferase
VLDNAPVRVAIVICTRDRPALLRDAVAAAMAARRAQDEVVVVDSASAPDAAAAVSRVVGDAGARLVRCDRPGASLARNEGVVATTAEIVAFTDDDCRPRAGWAAAVADAFAADARIGFVTGRVEPVGDVRLALSAVTSDAARTFAAGDDPAAAGSGANMAFRRAAFVAAGGFDERFGPGARFPAAEDHDLFWRVLAAGWSGRFDPESIVDHIVWRGLREFLAANYRYGVGSGALAVAMASGPGGERRSGRPARIAGQSIRRAVAHARAGYEAGALGSLATTAGVVRGAVAARRGRLSAPGPARP